MQLRSSFVKKVISVEMSHTDGQRYRKDSFASLDEEKIEIKPSTELIADEYEHDSNNACIHIFKSSYIKESEEEIFAAAMANIGYNVPKKNLHPLDNAMEVLDTLRDICNTATVDMSLLIILFIGVFESEDRRYFKTKSNPLNIMETWPKFDSRRCPNLKNKPKIFIFEAIKKQRLVEADIAIRSPSKKEFDTPLEGDMLIIYKEIKDTSDANYLDQFCDNIEQYARKEDIITLSTYTENPYSSQPLIISTLTRRLFLTPSGKRGHHLTISESTETLTRNLDNVYDVLEKIQAKTLESNKKPDSRWGKLIRRLSSRRTIGNNNNINGNKSKDKKEPARAGSSGVVAPSEKVKSVVKDGGAGEGVTASTSSGRRGSKTSFCSSGTSIAESNRRASAGSNKKQRPPQNRGEKPPWR